MSMHEPMMKREDAPSEGGAEASGHHGHIMRHFEMTSGAPRGGWLWW